MKYTELATLLKNAAESGTANAIKEEQPFSDWLTKVDTTQIFPDRSELEAIVVLSNRITYLPITDR